jgi:hypothetical protein
MTILGNNNNNNNYNEMVNTGFVHYLDQGLWYFSLLNDNRMPLRFKLKTEFYGKFK